jgi:hypothetical protein
MWFTPVIPGVYLLSRGDFRYDAHAYKPLLYFRSHGLSGFEPDFTPGQLLAKYGKEIVPYTPSNPNLNMSLSRGFPVRIVVVCETIPSEKIDKRTPLNHQKVVGELHAAVADPMPSVSPGSSWNTSIISQDFGVVDRLRFTIPKDLEDIEPLGDSWVAPQILNRPPCLLDVDYCGLTWPLRLKINDCDIIVKRTFPKEIIIRRPGTKGESPVARPVTFWQRRKIRKLNFGHPSIKIH